VGVTQSKLQKKIDTLQSVFSKEFGKKLLLPDDPRPFFDNRSLGYRYLLIFSTILNQKSYNAKIEWISSLTKKVFTQSS
jgi:hypothetical protein